MVGQKGPSFPGGDYLYSKRTIDEVKRSVDIVDFIGRYVNLEKSGSYFRGLCPFHSDNDPSFYVQPARGFFHCFGCGENGDVIAFLQKAEEISFNDALGKLADIAGIVTEARTESESQYGRYVRMLALASDYYHKMITRERFGKAAEYLKDQRGVSQQTIDLFKIGFAPFSSNHLRAFLLEKGFKNEEIESSGLVFGKGGSTRERFSGRLTFPIENESGRIVALGGRAVEEDTEPKYVNSPETRYFKKSRTLYNFSRARTPALQLDFVVVTEGYFDVLALYESGIQNVVGVLGTALTESHVRMISSVTKNVILFYDSDASGLRACKRSIELAERNDLDVAVVSVEEKDPSELFSRQGAGAVKEALKDAVPAPVFVVELIGRSFDLTTPEGKQKLFEGIQPVIESYKTSGKVGSFQQAVSRLSTLTRVGEDVILGSLRDPQRIRTTLRSTRSSLRPIERELIVVYLRFPEMRQRLLRILDLFESSEAFRTLDGAMRANNELEDIVRRCDASTGKEIISLAGVPLDPSIAESILDEVEDRVDKRIIAEQIRSIDRKLQAEIDVGTKNSLMRRRIELSRLLKKARKDGESVGKEQVRRGQ